MLRDKKEFNRNVLEIICPEMAVPKDHLLRKVDAAVDFDHIYTLVKELYCPDNGRPGTDPVVLFKIVLLQHLYGIPSLRRTVSEIEMNIAYRWFLGYGMLEQIPHFATVSYNFRNRFGTELIEQIFQWILGEIEKAGYLSPEVVYVDGTHIKASANLHKQVKKAIPAAAKSFEKELREEVNEDRESHGKKPFNGDPPPEEKTVTESTTDPDCGVFHKGEHKKCMAYGAHTACDDFGYILAVEVTPGNVHDSAAFAPVYRRLAERFPDMKYIAADSAYKTPAICRMLLQDGRTPSLPYTMPKTKKGNLPWQEYVYDEYYDCVICPQYKLLRYSTTNREGYREYKSDPKECANCPVRAQCTKSRNCQKVILRHLWRGFVEEAEELRHMPLIKGIYKRRKETIERVFADAKEKYGMRYTNYRGKEAVTKWVLLKFAAMNLKKMAIRKWRERPLSSYMTFLSSILSALFTAPRFSPIFNEKHNPLAA